MLEVFQLGLYDVGDVLEEFVRNECKNLTLGIFTTLLGDFVKFHCTGIAQLFGTFFILFSHKILYVA